MTPRTGSWPLALRLARRELRTGLKGFRIFLACLAIGVAAIAAVGSVSSAMMAGLEGDARRLLGGDVDLRLVHRPASDEQRAWLQQSGRVSEVLAMRAMARRTDGEARTLVELKAVDGGYPLVGTVTLAPAGELGDALAERDGLYGAIAEESLATRLDLAVGDRLVVGDATLVLRGILTGEPDRIVTFASFGPRLMVAAAALPATGLVQPGSLIRYHYRVALPPGTDAHAWLDDLGDRFPDAGWRTRALDSAAPGFDRFVDRTTLFLTLVGLTSLLVGGVGVAMAVKAYLDGKTETIATLKCLGAPSRLVFRTYLAVVLALATVGTLIGLAVGATAPIGAAALAGPLLPFDLPVRLYPLPLAVAAAYGLLTALAFSLWPLGRAGQVQAVALFRAVVAPLAGRPAPAVMASTAGAVALLAALAVATAEDRGFAGWFVVGAVAAFALFLAAARLVMAAARRAGRPRDPELRIALANLHRPGAPTPGVVLSLGLGLTVLIAVALIQSNLARQVAERLPNAAPAFFFIDIQPDQAARFRTIVDDMPAVTEVRTTPMVRGRIAAVNGADAEALTVDPDSAWALRGDRGLTYSADPPEGAEIVAGRWWSRDYAGPPLVSFDAGIAEDFGIGVGDSITLNVLGRPITAEIANLRRIDWSSMSMNFIFVFAPGTLEAAPHSIIATVRVSDPTAEAGVQRRVTDALPNVTAIRVKDAIEAADRILRAVSTAVRATAGVTLVAGVLVLAGAVAAGHARRVRDAVILKVLGATRGRILKAYALEYGILGLATAGVAAVIGSAAAFAVVTLVMRADFVLAPEVVAAVAAIATAITLALGFVGTWQALGQRPAPLLRNE
ncbi:FtsX-like permease family protein [Thalassobaculum sp.]|uniref:ABC transporter permease n=1 Tax=Thalassobaculum sp. TaxID=2022740 RepID=UPI0032EFDA22